jgi:hypothetical protein
LRRVQSQRGRYQMRRHRQLIGPHLATSSAQSARHEAALPPACSPLTSDLTGFFNPQKHTHTHTPHTYLARWRVNPPARCVQPALTYSASVLSKNSAEGEISTRSAPPLLVPTTIIPSLSFLLPVPGSQIRRIHLISEGPIFGPLVGSAAVFFAFAYMG